MKKITLLLAIILTSTSTSFAQKNNIEKDIKMYTQVWDDIINKGEIDKINTTYFDTNITAITSPENIVGIEDFKAFYQNYLTGFSNVTFTIIDVFGQGDKIVKHWNFKGKHTGDFFGIPATDKMVDIDGVTLVKMKKGKISQEQDFLDNMVFLSQLGLVSYPENINTIDSLYKSFAIGDIPSVLAAMDSEIVWNEAEGNSYADGNPYIGPDAVINGVFARIGADHEYFKLKDIELHEMSNDQVLATLRYDAKYKNDNAYNAQVAHLWTLKDGKIIAFQQYVDTKKLADAENK
ncbi:hypothetical protein SAMN05428642_103459 [Flaviramulus basaltis]|uniref:SnoaL-like domain-containing protein n=1 Tax=Flaviramulus basaltis TaxID=369401 RepID=A0A1K2INL3_9FLAO|nr:ester cyclase [Flaviramulus basaltis]SFZ93959.1 hypothetical protein SAMN05428642_103459 [Flaviramulus basaltis]